MKLSPPTLKLSMLAGVPHSFIRRVGEALGSLAFFVDVRHRRIVSRNLRFAMPEMGPSWAERTTRKVFQNAAITFLEILQIAVLSQKDILEKIRIKGEEHFSALKQREAGAIIISAHLGNWEMAHIFGACYLNEPLMLIARKVNPDFLNRRINSVRSRFGSKVFDKKSALPKMARALKDGKILGILIDQGTKSTEGVEVTFFGKRTTATPVAAILAQRYQVPVVPAFCFRRKDGGLEIVVQPPLNLYETDNFSSDIVRNTQLMTNIIEQAIRAHPEQWFWFHKRWKRHYPYLYREDIARKERERRKRKAKR